MAIQIHVTREGIVELSASPSYLQGEAGGDFTNFERLVRTEEDGTKVVKETSFATYQEVAESEVAGIVRNMLKNGIENRPAPQDLPGMGAVDEGDDLDNEGEE